MLPCPNMAIETDTKTIDKIFADLSKWLFVRYPINLKEERYVSLNSTSRTSCTIDVFLLFEESVLFNS